MPRDASGAYTAPASSWNPAIDGQNAQTDHWNALLQDLAAALTGSLAADGSTQATDVIPFAYGISVTAGSVTSPAVQITGDATTGFYAPGAGKLTFLCGGSNVLALTSTSVTVSQAATFSAALTASGNASIAGAAGTLGFYGSAGTARPTVSGAKGGNAALGSLISALAALGLIVDGTSA